MIYLKLFLTFLKIGAVSFGGGYGMISLIREDCLGYGWLTEEELLNFIAVAVFFLLFFSLRFTLFKFYIGPKYSNIQFDVFFKTIGQFSNGVFCI